MSFNIEVEGGTSVRLPTKGKYCDRDIVVTAKGAAAEPIIEPLEITENGTYTAPDGMDGYSPVTVNVASSGGVDERFDDLINGTLAAVESNVTKVRTYAFYGLTSITAVNLPQCTSIGSRAFQNCSKIESFNAPKVTSLGTYCFYGNNAMKEYNFPLAATVPNNAFYSCAGLVKADFGVAKSIGSYGFYSCSKLEALILRKSDAIVTITSNSLTASGIAKGTGYAYVPAALVDSYKANSTWATFADQIRALEDYTVDGTITGELDESKI